MDKSKNSKFYNHLIMETRQPRSTSCWQPGKYCGCLQSEFAVPAAGNTLRPVHHQRYMFPGSTASCLGRVLFATSGILCLSYGSVKCLHFCAFCDETPIASQVC